MGIEVFPPYGTLARPYAAQILQPRVPDHYTANADWAEFMSDTVAEINAVLWPTWDYSACQWTAPDHERMLALTQADFAVLDTIGFDPPALSRNVLSPDGVAWLTTQEAFFLDEDADDLGVRAPTYTASMQSSFAQGFSERMRSALRAKVGTASMEAKARLQRPRAYQISAMLGLEFSWTTGASSMSPSMSSGHSLQGLLMTAGAIDMWLEAGNEISDSTIGGLEQFAVDVGDRRVYAGIHYPSDNLASWLIAARLAPHVLRTETAKAFVANAVLERSEVWKLLVAATGSQPVLDAPTTHVRAALERCAG